MIATTACIALVASLVAAQNTTASLNTTASTNYNTTASTNYNTTASMNYNTTASMNDNTTAVNYNTTAPMNATTTGIAAVTCTDDACCQKFEEGEQPCTKCAKSYGCTYYGLFNNNVFSAGGKCVLATTATPPTTGYKKIEKYGECADLCAKLECSACIEIPECKWCDTAAAVGVGSTGSCELEKCLTGVTALTTCSATTNAVAAFAAVVALVASL